jgi:hypothetical protein
MHKYDYNNTVIQVLYFFYRPVFINEKFVENIHVLLFLGHKNIFCAYSKILDLRHMQQVEISELTDMCCPEADPFICRAKDIACFLYPLCGNGDRSYLISLVVV